MVFETQNMEVTTGLPFRSACSKSRWLWNTLVKSYPENVCFAEEEDHGGVKEDLAVGYGREEFERFSHVIRLHVRRAKVRVCATYKSQTKLLNYKIV